MEFPEYVCINPPEKDYVFLQKVHSSAIFLEFRDFINYRYANHSLKKCWRFGKLPKWHVSNTGIQFL